jgi:gas vesicle protein
MRPVAKTYPLNPYEKEEKTMTKTPEESTCWGSLLAGLMLGGLAGVACGLLFAPKAGHETRAELAERLEEVKTRVDETTRTLAEAAKTRMQGTGADLRQAMQDGYAAAKSRAEELRRQVEKE